MPLCIAWLYTGTLISQASPEAQCFSYKVSPVTRLELLFCHSHMAHDSQINCNALTNMIWYLQVYSKMATREICLKGNDVHTLTHLPIVPHICIRELGQHWFR